VAGKPKTTKRQPPRPQLDRYVEARDRRDNAFVDARVTPYVRHLLNAAQARTSDAIKLFQGMGTEDIDWSSDDTSYGRRADAVSAAVRQNGSYTAEPRVLYVRKYFPELVELIVLLGDVDEKIGGQVGDLEPTTAPAPAPTEADLAWRTLTEEDD
jgi:hypothetical protein